MLNEPIERYDVEKVDYAGEEDQSKEWVNANEQLHWETQAVVSRLNNDDGNSSLKTYTRSGRLVKHPDRLNL